MRIKKTILAIACAIAFCSGLTGCVSSTNAVFETDVADCEVFIDGEPIGRTPASAKLSNAIWEDPDVVIKKDGYKTLNTVVKKEVKSVNLVCGILLWWPSLLYVYGPKKTQNFMMTEEFKTNGFADGSDTAGAAQENE